MSRRILGPLMLCLLLVGVAHGQDAPERTIFPVDLHEDARLSGGKSAFLEGTTNPFGQQFQVLGTQLQQPIAIGVYARDPTRPVQLRIAKGSLDEPLSEAQTDADGRIDMKFRTYDGFKLWISAAEPSDYQLVVWVGDEMAVHPPRVVVPASEYAAGRAGVASAAGGVLAGHSRLAMGLALLAILVVLGFVFVSRRKASRSTP